MTYLALYRKWRPRLLSEIAGQKHVTETLRNAVAAGKVSHAYLFCGPRGTGKTSAAKVLARAINCPEQKQGEPCNQCQVCMEIISGAAMDVIEIDAASNRGIDEIRELRDNIKYFPSLGIKRVYIVDEVHMLTNEAFNALLKTLEEPPRHVVFVLATTEPHKVPLTILSRCQRFDFRPIPVEIIEERLGEVVSQSGFQVHGEAVKVIARAAAGSLRDALSLLDQAVLLAGNTGVTVDTIHSILGTVRGEVLEQLARGVAEKNAAAVLGLIATIAAEGKDLYLLTGELTEYLRSILLSMLNAVKEDSNADGDSNRRNSAGFTTRSVLVRVIDLMVEAEQTMRRSAHPRVVLEIALIKAINEPAQPFADELLQRVERLERLVAEGGSPKSSCAFDSETNLGTNATTINIRDEQCGQDGASENDTSWLAQLAGAEEKFISPVVAKAPLQGNTKEDEVLYCPITINSGSGKTKKPAPAEVACALPHEGPLPEAGTIDHKPQQEMSMVANGADNINITISKAGLTDIGQIRKIWPDLLAAIRKASPALYTYLGQIWPAEIKDNCCLVLGVEQGDDFFKQMVEEPDNIELLARTLQSFTSFDWQIRCNYYDARPAGWGEQEDQLAIGETINLFQAEEIAADNEHEVEQDMGQIIESNIDQAGNEK